ncbi:acyl-CoA dehydrogenase family protein [Parapusillimonas granuli]|uniref:Acyl-CoA/acyl-ACP dehydrogenase n=1 Tax=Parapusillimonas granuli TaxID=380911 RepID=A0A853FY57_9BURK|nr:acyl-CoA dehydrogenase family protein [Parapusillimonas granuli]MBB5214555.1 alkylation response protein AidB-like acyl-CoA dehydrogenase [Parapusillimonas granuli]MEB2398196.1 acyl-CoA/acyl-ACP dehydrogenase [Alcaligenaceae bacterium]NYT49037.1 acyl-CoA/acyl-ACP dehydrogenase [Parapusillimonas granuli]
MNFLTEEQALWQETVARVMEKEVTREYVRQCDTDRQYPYEAYEKIARMGWLRLLIPEEQGGDGGTIFDYALMCEGLARYGFDFATAFMVSTFTAMNIVKYGTPEQREQYLEPFMKGAIRFSISISEPSAGSDAANTKTRAETDGRHWTIRGQKLWCSGAAAKNTVIAMLVRTDKDAKKHRGLSVLLVPNDTHGVDIRRLPTLARRATGTTEIFLDGAQVPAGNILGAPGMGWEIITDHLELERIAVAAAYVGNAQQAVTDALRYAHERIQFDKSIFEFQVLRHMLADMQTSVDAARLLVYRAADMATRGEPCSREVSMAKLFASETLQTVTRNGMQILGGHSMLPEADMERYFREGMQSTIGGGTSQIQRTIIAKSLRL